MKPRSLPYSLSLLALLLALGACTPKAAPTTTATTTPTAPTTTTTPKPNPNQPTVSQCRKFSDTADPDQAETDYVIYRQQLKAENMTAALQTWRTVYANSPAADGLRPTVYTDGVAFYNYLLRENPDKREMYGDSIIALYAEARRCYPGDGYMAAIQGFDSYYTYPGSATDAEIYDLFKEAIEIDGPEKLQYFVINPMANLVQKRHRDGEIDDAEAKMITTALRARLAKGLADCSGAECDPWNTINGYTPQALSYFETVEGFYDCTYYSDKYYAEYQEAPEDCDVVTTAYARMRYGGCGDDDARYVEVRDAYANNCRVVEGPKVTLITEARDALENGNYSLAISKLNQAAEETDDAARKSSYLLTIGKIYYGQLRNFSQARNYARQAATADPTNGEPYMLIGNLYASSGPLCGTGTGFLSQTVTWVAIDKWQQAKRIQPDLAGKANNLINRYTKYMPSKGDVFQRGLKEGGSYTVGCWINERTTVRTP